MMNDLERQLAELELLNKQDLKPAGQTPGKKIGPPPPPKPKKTQPQVSHHSYQ